MNLREVINPGRQQAVKGGDKRAYNDKEHGDIRRILVLGN
jgi:hypothetical protein